MEPRTVLLAGATGLVGGALLDLLLADERFTVVSVGRRPTERSHPRLTQRTVDFGALGTDGSLPRADVAVCCLGTTIKKAGSPEAFRAVDHDAVLAFARGAKSTGTERFLVVTAIGADPGSWKLYNRVKGETETDLRALGFASLGILQPSLLLGDRAERRAGEHAAIVVSRALAPLLRPFAARPIEATTVARALRALALESPPGARVYPSGEIHGLAERA